MKYKGNKKLFITYEPKNIRSGLGDTPPPLYKPCYDLQSKIFSHSDNQSFAANLPLL